MAELKNDEDYFPYDWEPQQDVGIVFDDQTAEKRSKEEMGKMVRQMRDLANEFGFDLSCWGAGHITGFKKV